jgi:hypothetical protein
MMECSPRSWIPAYSTEGIGERISSDVNDVRSFLRLVLRCDAFSQTNGIKFEDFE